MNQRARILVAGRDTLIGVGLMERLRAQGYRGQVQHEGESCDLTVASDVDALFAELRPEYVFVAAGISGGIGLNQRQPAALMLNNLLATTHVIEAARRHGVEKLLYLASSCCYPRLAPQPLDIDALFTAPLEPTNAAYATAKLAGWQLCSAYRQQYGVNFITGVPANSFGPHDDFSEDGGHVIPALIRRADEAKRNGESSLTIWGTGRPRREFIFVADLADACIFVMKHHDGADPINLGSGVCLSIAEVAQAVADTVGYRGRLRFDPSKPDGMPLKCLDSTPLERLGWRATTPFRDALAATYRWYQQTSGACRTAATAATGSPRPLEDRSMYATLYRELYRIRRVEEEIARIYPTDKVKSPVHLSIGQEAVSVGVCAALAPADVVFGTYRGHALYLSKGGDLKEMIAELYGKKTGCTGGKGGSMHLIAPDAGVMGMSAVVGTTIANAIGYAYAHRYRRHSGIVVSFFGDGASEEGVFSESLNFAVLKKLPILFVCENNGYAIHTSQAGRQGRPDIRARAEAHGLPAERLDGNDVLALVDRARANVAAVRAGEGPRFLEVMTYRCREHVGPATDAHLGYRPASEAEAWLAHDPMHGLAQELTPAERSRIEIEVDQEVADAFAFAEASPFPDGADLTRDVFTEELPCGHHPR